MVFDGSGASSGSLGGTAPTQEIFTVSSTGGPPVQPTHNDVPDNQAAYSPDGTQIAFVHGRAEIWLMNESGGDQRKVFGIPSTFASFTPRRSPEGFGSKIAFTVYDPAWRASVNEGGSEVSEPVLGVYVLDLATAQPQKVGNAEVAGDVNAPQWLPSGDALLLNLVTRP